jgi:hypothetical protein
MPSSGPRLRAVRTPNNPQAGYMDLGWIWTDNLRPLLVELATLAGCHFDDSDWIAFEHGMQGADTDAGPWFDYPVGHLSVTAAFETGAEPFRFCGRGSVARSLASAWVIAGVIRNSTQLLLGGQIVPMPGGPARMRGREPCTGMEACAVWRRRRRVGPEHRARLLAEWF